MTPIGEFFQELDRDWNMERSSKIRLHIIGSGALLLRLDYERGTRDADVFVTVGLDGDIQNRLRTIAGPSSTLATRRRMTIDIVQNGIPFLPNAPVWHAVEIELRHFELAALDPVDVVVSKLKRMSANDRADIQAMIFGDYVEHTAVVSRFRTAVDDFAGDARAEDLPRYVANLHDIERNVFRTSETAIELPEWIG